MPTFTINTNVSKDKIPPNFLEELSKLVAEQVEKQEKYVSIHVKPEQMMTFAGTSQPCALCSFSCIGKIGTEENNKYTKVLMEKINKDLGIEKDRMYINFTELQRPDCGWNGKTFAS